jgi:TonB family protein
MGTPTLEITHMRKVIVAALALSPLMLHAQASSPAQPQSSTMQARFSEPSALIAAADTNRTTTPTGPRRISSGVVAPKLVSTVDISTSGNAMWNLVPLSKTVVVGMIVDPSGKPTELKIIQSAGETMDKNILEAVSQYRFTPGTVSHQAVASPLKLEIEMRSPSR